MPLQPAACLLRTTVPSASKRRSRLKGKPGQHAKSPGKLPCARKPCCCRAVPHERSAAWLASACNKQVKQPHKGCHNHQHHPLFSLSKSVRRLCSAGVVTGYRL